MTMAEQFSGIGEFTPRQERTDYEREPKVLHNARTLEDPNWGRNYVEQILNKPQITRIVTFAPPARGKSRLNEDIAYQLERAGIVPNIVDYDPVIIITERMRRKRREQWDRLDWDLSDRLMKVQLDNTRIRQRMNRNIPNPHLIDGVRHIDVAELPGVPSLDITPNENRGQETLHDIAAEQRQLPLEQRDTEFIALVSQKEVTSEAGKMRASVAEQINGKFKIPNSRLRSFLSRKFHRKYIHVEEFIQSFPETRGVQIDENLIGQTVRLFIMRSAPYFRAQKYDPEYDEWAQLLVQQGHIDLKQMDKLPPEVLKQFLGSKIDNILKFQQHLAVTKDYLYRELGLDPSHAFPVINTYIEEKLTIDAMLMWRSKVV